MKMNEFSDALCVAEPFFSAPEVLFIVNARKELAPHHNTVAYYQKVIDFMVKGKFHAIWAHEKSAQRSACRKSNQSCGTEISGLDKFHSLSIQVPPYLFRVNYHGCEHLSAIQDSGHPAIFMAWHNSAFYLIPYALCEIITDLQVFTYTEFKYIDKLSIPMKDGAAVSLLKMAKILENNTPILHYFDGPLGKRDLRYTLFGTDAFFARGIMQLLRSYSPSVIPVTSYLKGEADADIYIGNDLFARKNLETLSDYQIFNTIMEYFINDLRTKDPTQFLMYYWLKAYTSKLQ
ncbi:MAG: hypothetical protein WCI77_07180 [Candidatus Omnitrophota bacterium]